MLSYLFWELHHYPDLPTTVEIDGGEYQIIHGWSVCGNTDPPWKSISKEKLAQIEAILEKVNYWQWERSYTDPHILDGTTWEIKVRGGKTGGRRKNSEGVNGFPPGWDEVEAAIMELDK